MVKIGNTFLFKNEMVLFTLKFYILNFHLIQPIK